MGPIKEKIALAIESSCDETAVALVNDSGRVIDQCLFSQIEIHKKYGGVVPEIASRSHFEVLDGLVEQIFAQNPNIAKSSLEFVAATKTPGLIGPLLVGATYAEAFAKGLGIEFRGVHHLRGHLAATLLSETEQQSSLEQKAKEIFPALVLLASGGHTAILQVSPNLEVRQLLKTVDDAAGECFDKSAKLLNLGYPGGPIVEKLAESFWQSANDTQKQIAQEIYKSLPSPKTQDGDFSFSGLKTAIRLCIEKAPQPIDQGLYCWAIQNSISDTLGKGVQRAIQRLKNDKFWESKSLIFCGGVAANKTLRAKVESIAKQNNLAFIAPPIKYCTDNAAMIGAAAWIQLPSLAPLSVQARAVL